MTGINGSHHLQTDNTGARASSQKVLVQGKLYVCSLSFHTMNFLSSVTSARHDHPGQRVLKYFSRFQQQNALLEETLGLSQKENALQRELTARLPASLHGHHYEPILKTFRNYLTDRLMGIGLFPRPGEVIDKVSSMVVVWLAKSQRMRLCQCLGLVISTSISGLSAGILELPLFFPRSNPDNVLSPPHSHWRAVADEPVVLDSRLSGDRAGSVRHSGSDRDSSTSFCIESDTPDLSQKTGFPGCLPLPEGSANVFVSIADGKMVLPVNTTVSETSEETSVVLLPCDQEPCVALDYRGRMSLLDLAEMTLPGESGTAERETRKIREVVQTCDQNGNIIYQWYDQDGHLHTIREWEFKRRLSMYFQSLLEFLYPEYFGSSIPAGGGWHQWQYRKVRRTADRPENTGQQRWPARQKRHRPNGKTARPVAAVPPVQQARFTKYHPRHKNNQPQPSPSGGAIGRSVENEIDRLLMEFESGHMQSAAARYKKNYDGRQHGQYCNKIKNATRARRKPLTDDEKLRFVPFMRHLSEVVYSFNGRSLSTCVHSLVASQLLYLPRSIPGQRTVSGGEGGSIKKAQKVLIEQLARVVESRATLQGRAPCGFNAQEISNLLWALAKLVENGLLQLDQDGLASQMVTALLPQVQSHQDDFTSQHVSNLLWALAKLVENRLLQLDQDGLAIQAATVLLPQVQSHQDDFISQGVSNLLWALAKLVDNELLQLDQGGLASQTVTALLSQVQSRQDDFTSQGVSNSLWALAKLVENGLLQKDQGFLASQVVTALLRRVVTPPVPFTPQEISNLLWALAKLVENGLLQLDQGGLASQTVTALLLKVVTPPGPFTLQEISNLLWALAKLVENRRLQLDQGDLARQAVTTLLPKMQSHQDDFISQHVSNLLWALAKLVENGLLQLDQDGLANQAVTALLPQVVTPPEPFISQHISNLLWALAKLVENGLPRLDQDGLAVTALLSQVVTPPEPFNSQNVSNLLWALAKLVENGRLQLDQGGLTSQAVTALLLQVVPPSGPFKPQGTSNLLWALAKLVENGLLQLDQDSLASQAVMALLPQVVTPPGPFIPQEISNLLWALAALGDGVSLNEVLNILGTMDINTIELWPDQEMTLWALTVFLARDGETSLLLPSMKRLYDALMAEKENSSNIRASIMWPSGIWLKENLRDLPLPNYKTTVSQSHRELYKFLRVNFPRHTLEMEASVDGLPPVDLLFSYEKVVVEVQGAHHYIDKEKKLRNGSTILKTSTYEKLGYKVFEIPASDMTDRKKREQLLRKLDACFLNRGNSADSSTESDYETAEEDNWFSAEDEP